MALAMLAVSLALRKRTGWAVLALTAAALTKDAYLLFALGLAGWMFLEGERRSAVAVALVPVIPLALWIAWLSWQVGDGSSAKDNFPWPLVGSVESFSEWETTGDLVQLCGAGRLDRGTGRGPGHRRPTDRVVNGPVDSGGAGVVRTVWGDGNNAVRAFAPLWLSAWLGVAWWVQSQPSMIATRGP